MMHARSDSNDPGAEMDDRLRRAAGAADAEFDALRVRADVEARVRAAEAGSARHRSIVAVLAAAAAVAAIAVGVSHAAGLVHRPALPSVTPAAGPTSTPASRSARGTARAVVSALRATDRPYCVVLPKAHGEDILGVVRTRDGRAYEVWQGDPSCKPLKAAGWPKLFVPGAFPFDLGAPLRLALAHDTSIRLSGDALTVEGPRGDTTTYRLDLTTMLPHRIDQRGPGGRLYAATTVTWLAASAWPRPATDAPTRPPSGR